jgi:hypothetical protein
MTLPSRTVTLATIAAAFVLAAGGFVLGKGSDPPKLPPAVPVQAILQPPRGSPIVVPPGVTLPRR